MTINSLINFKVPPRISDSAAQMAQEIVGCWALGDAPASLTLGDIRKLTTKVAAGLERYHHQEEQRALAVERLNDVS